MKKLTNIEKEAVNFIREYGGEITIPELCLQLSISRMKAYNLLKQMKNKGLLESKYIKIGGKDFRVKIILKDEYMNNTITVPTTFNLQGHNIKAGQRIEIIESSESTFEMLGARVYRLKKDFDIGDLCLKNGQIIRIIGKDE